MSVSRWYDSGGVRHRIDECGQLDEGAWWSAWNGLRVPTTETTETTQTPDQTQTKNQSAEAETEPVFSLNLVIDDTWRSAESLTKTEFKEYLKEHAILGRQMHEGQSVWKCKGK